MTREIEPELLQRLGLLVTRWAFVEQCVSDLFILLTKGDPGAMPIVTANVSNRSVVEWTRTLLDIRYHTDEWQLDREAREALQDVDELRNERNALVHGLWGTEGPPGSACVQTVRLDRKEIIRDVVVTAADLDDLIDDILSVTERLLSILKRAKGEA